MKTKTKITTDGKTITFKYGKSIIGKVMYKDVTSVFKQDKDETTITLSNGHGFTVQQPVQEVFNILELNDLN